MNIALRVSSFLLLELAILMLVPPSPARAEIAPGDTLKVLNDAELAIIAGDYEQATPPLAKVVEENQDLSVLRRAYLLLVWADVATARKKEFDEKNDRVAEMFLESARKSVRSCLLTPGLADMRPRPSPTLPVKVVELFEEERSQLIGGFRITRLEPLAAKVLLNGQELEPIEATGLPGDDNLPAGTYTVEVSCPGYRTEHSAIEVRGGVTLDRDVKLEKGRDWRWWGTRGALVAAGILIGSWAIIDSNGQSAEPEPLPGPPDPPQ